MTSFEFLKEPGRLAPLKACCRTTVITHLQHNQMMVCPECKTLIKCFFDRAASQNFERFCKSKNRRILSFEETPLFFVLYNDYDATGK